MSEQPERLNAEQSQEIRARQVGRTRIMAAILFALAALFFAITVVKIGVWE